jgi:hypothetical protein
MESDAAYIGMVDNVRAVKYVLVSGFSAIVSLMTTLSLLILMMRMRLDGPPPYYVNRNNLTRIPFVLIFVVYGFLFDRIIAGMSAETSHFARAIFHTDWCLGLSACGIGLVGTVIVRTLAVYLRWFRDGSEFPANS